MAGGEVVFNFKNMLKEYEQDIIIIEHTDGYWCPDTGDYIEEGEEEAEVSAAVLPLTNDELTQDEGGTYTAEDKKIYYHGDLETGQTVKIDNLQYKVDAAKDYSHHASGLKIYIVVRKG